MNVTHLLIFALIGLVAGFLAGKLMKGSSLGLWGNLLVGCVGALIGGFLANLLNIRIGGELIGPLIIATGGACLLLFLLKLVKI